MIHRISESASVWNFHELGSFFLIKMVIGYVDWGILQTFSHYMLALISEEKGTVTIVNCVCDPPKLSVMCFGTAVV